jgi:HSP20 family protein
MNLLSRFGGRLWDPWREIGHLQQEMGRLLSGARAMTGLGPREYPPVNVYVNEHELLVMLELPGIEPATVDLTVTGGTVSIRGERPAEAAQNSQNFHRRERPAGAFERKVELPYEVDPAKTAATFERGVLKIKLSRPESQRPRKVPVNAS